MNVQGLQTITGRREGVRQSAAEVVSNDDRWLVAQAKGARASAFGELYECHRLKIYRTAYRILSNDRFSVRSRTSADFAKTPLLQPG